ncbi:hypothetical protein ABPG72_014465 [Tetrahymena utriculariae]
MASMFNPQCGDFYYKPWCRIPPYLLCLLFGLAIIIYLIFGFRPLEVNGIDYSNQNAQDFIYGISRILYSLAVIQVLLPSACGSRDLIVKNMSSSIFQLMSKLTFQGYLYHYAIETYSLWAFYDSMYLSVGNVQTLYLQEISIIPSEFNVSSIKCIASGP